MYENGKTYGYEGSHIISDVMSYLQDKAYRGAKMVKEVALNLSDFTQNVSEELTSNDPFNLWGFFKNALYRTFSFRSDG